MSYCKNWRICGTFETSVLKMNSWDGSRLLNIGSLTTRGHMLIGNFNQIIW